PQRLDGRLERSCVRPRFAPGPAGATGTVDAVARTGGVTLTQGTSRFAKTRRAARGVRSLSLGHLGVQLSGQGGFLVGDDGERIARIPRLTLTSGPLVARGRATPNTFRLTLSGEATALAPLQRLSRARCRGGDPRAKVRVGTEVGTVSLSYSPARAVGLGGTLGLRLFLDVPRDPATGTLRVAQLVPIAPADADGESIVVPITGSAPLVRGTGDAFIPAATVTTGAGATVVLGGARVELRDLAFGFSPARGLEVLSATIGGARHTIATLAPNRTWASDAAGMQAIANGLGVTSATVTSAEATASFTKTAAG
ncbi:MAG: hypothetical protein QOG77_3785, partial [Solirubrobacteraceae bacterium]|nr:hypothetical protein [Solirubrobacteraceae bacterium]